MTQPQTSPTQPQPTSKPKLRWFQFSMRTLLVIMLLVGCGLGWLIRDVREQEAVVEMIRRGDGRIAFGEPRFLGRIGVVRSLLGEHAFAPVTGVDLFDSTDAHIAKIKSWKKIQWLDISGSEVSDLSPLSGLTELTELGMLSTKVTNLTPLAGLNRLTVLNIEGAEVSNLTPLSGLSRLSYLYLVDTRVTDLSPLAGLRGLILLSVADSPMSDLSPIAGLNKLTWLNIRNTPVSDLSPLAGLSGLIELDIRRTRVTDLSPLSGLMNLKKIYLFNDQEVQVPDSLSMSIERSEASEGTHDWHIRSG